jgi:hypothetical protein
MAPVLALTTEAASRAGMGGARVFPCMPWNTQDLKNKHKYIYIYIYITLGTE